MKLMLTNVSCPVEPAGLRTDLTGNCVLTESDCERKKEEKHVEKKRKRNRDQQSDFNTHSLCERSFPLGECELESSVNLKQTPFCFIYKCQLIITMMSYMRAGCMNIFT